MKRIYYSLLFKKKITRFTTFFNKPNPQQETLDAVFLRNFILFLFYLFWPNPPMWSPASKSSAYIIMISLGSFFAFFFSPVLHLFRGISACRMYCRNKSPYLTWVNQVKQDAYRPTESVFVGEVLQGRLEHQGSSPRYGFSVVCGVQRPIGSWNLTGGTFIAVTEPISTLRRLNRGPLLKEVSLKRHGEMLQQVVLLLTTLNGFLQAASWKISVMQVKLPAVPAFALLAQSMTSRWKARDRSAYCYFVWLRCTSCRTLTESNYIDFKVTFLEVIRSCASQIQQIIALKSAGEELQKFFAFDFLDEIFQGTSSKYQRDNFAN